MLLTLTPEQSTPQSLSGSLLVDEVFECYWLTLPCRDGLPGSAIPAGTYPITLEPSPKFSLSTDEWVMGYAQTIPHLFQIPNRTNILIHWGNGPHDTDGCILVGQSRDTDFIGRSRQAFADLHDKISSALASGGTCQLEMKECSPPT